MSLKGLSYLPINQTNLSIMGNQTNIVIDLIKPSSDLAAKPAIRKILDKGQNVILLAKNLAKSLPELKHLGDLPIYGVRLSKNGGTVTYMPSLYRTSKGLEVCIPDLNASVTNILSLVEINLADNNIYCILTDGKINLKCNLSLDIDGLSRLKSLKALSKETFKAEDVPDNVAELIKERPALELPLDNLTLNTTYEIISNDGYSKKFQTPLISVKSEDGQLLQNVITNSDLRKYGDIGALFQIVLAETITIEKIINGKKIKETVKKFHIKWLDASLELVDMEV
jgi:hypothetical protein